MFLLPTVIRHLELAVGVADTPTLPALDHTHFFPSVDLMFAEAALLVSAPPPCPSPSCCHVLKLKLVGCGELGLQLHGQLALREIEKFLTSTQDLLQSECPKLN